MDPRDDDIQFDFFEDEPATTESQATRGRLPRRGGRGTGMGAAGRPAARADADAPAARACSRSSSHCSSSSACSCSRARRRRSTTRPSTTWTASRRSRRSSQDDGTAVANALITPGVKPTRSRRSSAASPTRSGRTSIAAQQLDAPGPLRDQNPHLVEALQLRVSGVQGLAADVRREPGLEDRRARRPCSPSRPTGCSRATSSGTTSSRIRARRELQKAGHHRDCAARFELRREPRPDDGALDGAAPDPPSRHQSPAARRAGCTARTSST